MDSKIRSGIKLSGFTVIINLFLAVIKIITGIKGNSYALVADGIESFSDVFSSAMVWISLRYSLKPADKEHPYGHGKAESIAALAVSSILIIAALFITFQSITEIQTPHHSPSAYTLYVLGIIIVFKEILFRIMNNKAIQTGSAALKSDAWHQRSDALTSLAAFIGISIALIGGVGYEAADDWAALIACAIIFYNGIKLFRIALNDIMDASPSAEFVQNVKEIAREVTGVVDIEKCRVRKSGLFFIMDIHVTVNGFLNVKEGHFIGHKVKDKLIQSRLNIQDVTVHIEPHVY
jgi:cation diffusion facilitator family transporter